jgi:N-acetylgalactosamine-N,N'-diacetylbacillosaminyl-diphospho-undecaprenol 4-alpha-N-acetylgalactosaminyltransferase
MVFFKLKSIRKQKNYKAIISYGIPAGFLNTLTSNSKSKAICTIHNISSIENKELGVSGKIFNFILKRILKNAYKVIGISQGISEDLIDNYGLNNVRTIYNPYIFKKNNPSVNLGANEGTKFVTAARLEKTKKIDKQIVSISKLIKNGHNVTLDIFGEGTQLENLKTLVQQLDIKKYVNFNGYVSNLKDKLRKYDFFLLNSKNEGFPNVLVESLLAGTPVITEDILSGPRELMNNLKRVSYITPMENEVEIYDKGIICTDIYLGMKYVTEQETNFNIELDGIKSKLNAKNIGEEYKRLIYG